MTVHVLHKPGERVRVSGLYICEDSDGVAWATEGGDAAEWTLVDGEHFPPAPMPGMWFRLERAAQHQDDESQPVPEPPRPDDIQPYTPRPQCAEPEDG